MTEICKTCWVLRMSAWISWCPLQFVWCTLLLVYNCTSFSGHSVFCAERVPISGLLTVQKERKNTTKELWKVRRLASAFAISAAHVWIFYRSWVSWKPTPQNYNNIIYISFLFDKTTTRWRTKLVLLHIPYIPKAKPLLEWAFRGSFILSRRATLSMYFWKNIQNHLF